MGYGLWVVGYGLCGNGAFTIITIINREHKTRKLRFQYSY